MNSSFDPMFFQAGAAVIPTLMIAITIGAAQGKILANNLATHHPIVVGISQFFYLFQILLIVAGELSALYVLALNETNNRGPALIVIGAITSCLFMLVEHFIRPVVDAYPARWRGLLFQVLEIIGLFVILRVWLTI